MLRGFVSKCRRRLDDCLGVLSLGKHVDQSGDDLQPPARADTDRWPPLAGVRLRDYRSHLGVVLQDNFLFDGTVAENTPRAPARLRAPRSSASAGSRTVTSSSPRSKRLRHRGRARRSSGASAAGRHRACHPRGPDDSDSDEATSSLTRERGADPDGLRHFGLDVPRSSRPPAVDDSQRQPDPALEAGQIVEHGTHAELLALNGRYRQLHDKQHELEEDRFVNPGEDFTPGARGTRSRGVTPAGQTSTLEPRVDLGLKGLVAHHRASRGIGEGIARARRPRAAGCACARRRGGCSRGLIKAASASRSWPRATMEPSAVSARSRQWRRAA